MRFYCKLALLTLFAIASQAGISSGIADDTYFAMRCLAAANAGDEAMERCLIRECERQFVAERELARTTLASSALASR